MLHTQYVFVYGDICILVIHFAPLKSNPGSATGTIRAVQIRSEPDNPVKPPDADPIPA